MKKKKPKENKNPNYAVGYCRYSSEGQRDESIEAQKREVQKYADEKGITIVKWYVDKAVSGTTADRKEFSEMIKDSLEEKWGVVFVHKLDRFSRDLYDSAYYKQKLKDNGVTVFSVIERLDDSPESIMMESVLMGMAAYYSKNLGRETLKGLKENAYKAMCNGSIAPYGFMRVPKIDEYGNPVLNKDRLPVNDTTIHPEQSEAVKIIYQMTLEGKKRYEILERLKELGYKKNNGEEFGGTYIDNILRNERYTGTYIFHYNKKAIDYDPERDVIRIPNGLPQIIATETFDAVQQILKQRVKNPSHVKEEYLLTGKIICGECSTPYTGARQVKGGKPYCYYKCNRQTTYKNGSHLAEHCRNNTVTRDKIEKYVIRMVSKILYNENALDKVLDEYNRFAAEVKDNTALIERYENQIKDIERQIQNVINAIAATGNFNENLQTKIDCLESEKKKFAELISQEKKAVAYLPATKDELRCVYKKAQEQLTYGTFEEKKTVLNMFLNKIVIFRKYVEIYVNLIPMSHLSGIDLDISANDYLSKLSEKDTEICEFTPETSENSVNDMKKDGIEPSFSYSPLYSEILIGSPGRI